MTRFLITISLLLASVSLFGQVVSDEELIHRQDFPLPEETVPEGTGFFGRVAEALNRQLVGPLYWGWPISTADRYLTHSQIGRSGRQYEPRPLPVETAPLPVLRHSAGGVSADFDFVNYLIDNGMSEEAVVLLQGTGYAPSDTLDYLRGWACYATRRLAEASRAFDRVPKGSPWYDKSLFFSAASKAYLGDYAGAGAQLESYAGPYADLRRSQLQDLAALQGPDTFARKSPLLAAGLSALLPGLGRVYTRQYGVAAESLLVCGGFAAVTAENWKKYGATNWRTLVFGTLGSLFYLGNIYGSYISVELYNDRMRETQDTAVLLHMHIPLRSAFR